jgi:hypothetical protein
MSQSIHKSKSNHANLKPNKSSIVRVIVSNFDSQSIKELKILYIKQGGVDTLLVDNNNMLIGHPDFYSPIDTHCQTIDRSESPTSLSSGKIDFGSNVRAVKSVLYNDPTHRYQPPLVSTSDGKIYVEKSIEGQKNVPYKKYEITGEWRLVKNTDRQKVVNTTPKTEVIITINDLMTEHSYLSDVEAKRRRASSKTNRILLESSIMNNYRCILSDSQSKIATNPVDSISIHRANTFLNYRSEMLYYFTFINHFFMHLDDIIKPICDRETADDKKAKNDVILHHLAKLRYACKGNFYDIAKHLDDSTNNYLENLAEALFILKNDWLKNYENNVKSHEKPNEKKNNVIASHASSFIYSKTEIKSDLKEIINVLISFRHALAHYNYQYFDTLYRNPLEIEKTQTTDEFSKLKHLKLFELLNTLPIAKMAQRHTYIDTNDTIYIMGKLLSLNDCAYLYDLIGAQKDGFKAIVNDFFTLEGSPTENVQNAIYMAMKKEIRELKNNSTYLSSSINQLEKKAKKERKDTDRIKNTHKKIEKNNSRITVLEKRIKSYDESQNKTLYYEDIHNHREYKKRYIEHKDLKQQLNNALLDVSPDKSKIKEYNYELRKLNDSMLEIVRC